MSGTQEGERSGGLVLAMAKFGEAPCVVVGQDRLFPREGRPLGPDSLREARRGMSLAAEIGLPLLTIIDTPGAALSRAAEEGGLAGEIARCLADMVALPVPTVCLLLGEGAGGGALALLPADRVVAAQHAWVAPLPPEGASEILYRTVAAPLSLLLLKACVRPTSPRRESSTASCPNGPTLPRRYASSSHGSAARSSTS